MLDRDRGLGYTLQFEASHDVRPQLEFPPMAMHYPRRVSKVKRVRMFGFRARMKTRLGRKMLSAKRRMGRRLAVK